MTVYLVKRIENGEESIVGYLTDKTIADHVDGTKMRNSLPEYPDSEYRIEEAPNSDVL